MSSSSQESMHGAKADDIYVTSSVDVGWMNESYARMQ